MSIVVFRQNGGAENFFFKMHETLFHPVFRVLMHSEEAVRNGSKDDEKGIQDLGGNSKFVQYFRNYEKSNLMPNFTINVSIDAQFSCRLEENLVQLK